MSPTAHKTNPHRFGSLKHLWDGVTRTNCLEQQDKEAAIKQGRVLFSRRGTRGWRPLTTPRRRALIYKRRK